jgi:DNA-binding transcriptional ArsR family regulator
VIAVLGGAAGWLVAQYAASLSNPTRPAIMSVLCAVDWCDFAFLRDEVSLSDSALSKQLTTLKKRRTDRATAHLPRAGSENQGPRHR